MFASNWIGQFDATRDELAEVHAEILSTPGHENKIHSLGGSDAISFSDFAIILAEIKGQPVPFTSITAEELPINWEDFEND